jgi:excisionase family DNA binding protein
MAIKREFVTAVELAERIGISRSSGYALLDSGEVRSVRIGGRRLIPIEEADRYVDDLHAQVAAR